MRSIAAIMAHLMTEQGSEADFIVFTKVDLYLYGPPGTDVLSRDPTLLVPAGSRVKIVRILDNGFVLFRYGENKLTGDAKPVDLVNFDEALLEFNRNNPMSDDESNHSDPSSQHQVDFKVQTAYEKLCFELEEAEDVHLQAKRVLEKAQTPEHKALAQRLLNRSTDRLQEVAHRYEDCRNQHPEIAQAYDELNEVIAKNDRCVESTPIQALEVSIENPRMDNETEETVLDTISHAQATSTPKDKPVVQETPIAPKIPNPKKPKRPFDAVDQSPTACNEQLAELKRLVKTGFKDGKEASANLRAEIEKTFEKVWTVINQKISECETRLITKSQTFTLQQTLEVQKQLNSLGSELRAEMDKLARKVAEPMDCNRDNDERDAIINQLTSDVAELKRTLTELRSVQSNPEMESLKAELAKMNSQLREERAKNSGRVHFAPIQTEKVSQNHPEKVVPVARQSENTYHNQQCDEMPRNCSTGRYTSMFLNDSFEADTHHETRHDRNMDGALRFVRQNPEKVPQRSRYSGMPIALFMCKVLHKFARNQGISQVNVLDQWLMYAFAEAQHQRINFILQNVRRNNRNLGLYDTLREVARKLEPDSYVGLESLGKRKSDETLVDFMIRLCSDLPIIQDVSDVEMPRKVSDFMIRSESNPAVVQELRREVYGFKGQMTEWDLFNISERVERLIGPSNAKIGINSMLSHESSIEEACYMPSHDIRSQVHAANQKGECRICKKSHMNKRPGGSFHPYCQECYINNFQKKPHQKFPTYNSPQISRKGAQKCSDCNNPTFMSRTGQAMQRCSKCYQDFRSSQNVNKRVNISSYNEIINRGTEEIGIDQIDDIVMRSQVAAIKVESIRKVNNVCAFRSDRYRMRAKVFNADKTKVVSGLIDTGCNTDALSLDACKELEIAHLIQKRSSPTTGVDGKALDVVGTVEATLNIGNVRYTNRFPVLNRMDGFDIMIGTRFLQSADVMTKVVDLMKDTIGSDNVTRTN